MVFFGDEFRFGDDGGFGFHIDEAVGAFEVEIDFRAVHHMENRDIVFLLLEVAEGVGEWCGVGEEVGKDHDEGAARGFRCDRMKGAGEAGFAGGCDRIERGKNPFEVGGAATGRDLELKFLCADREARGVALVDEQIGERCGDAAGKFEF